MRYQKVGRYATPEDRFWRKVDKSGECWLWQGATYCRMHYGCLGIGGRTTRAHRFSWELHNGPIPDGLCVLHRCDVPRCVNPDHLFLGTKLDNMKDRTAKGRHWESRKTHCPKGHEYNASNTQIWRNGRYCRTCQRARANARNQLRRLSQKGEQ